MLVNISERKRAEDALRAADRRRNDFLAVLSHELRNPLAPITNSIFILDEHEVTVAYNGPEGLERAREFKPEVVLCDIGLPGMDGYEVARAFRKDEALRDRYLVALSGYALPEDLQRASEAGFDKHLAKPPSLEKLEELLASLRASADAAPQSGNT